jgi:hypothetical protein
MRDRAVFWQFHHPGGDADYTKFESQCMFPYDDTRAPFAYTAVDHDVAFAESAGAPIRRLREGVVRLTRPDGGVERYHIEPVSYPVYLQGGGYFNGFDDQLGRGCYRGDLHGEGEVWGIDRGVGITLPAEPGKGIELQRFHYAEAWGRCTNLDDPTDVGDGHLECVVLGRYPGFVS